MLQIPLNIELIIVTGKLLQNYYWLKKFLLLQYSNLILLFTPIFLLAICDPIFFSSTRGIQTNELRHNIKLNCYDKYKCLYLLQWAYLNCLHFIRKANVLIIEYKFKKSQSYRDCFSLFGFY